MVKTSVKLLFCLLLQFFLFVEIASASNTIPDATTGFSFSLSGLELKPGASNLVYATYTQPLPITTPNWTQIVLKPSYSGSFDAEVQYNFADPKNIAALNWMHVGTNNSDSFYTTGVGSSVAPPYYFGPLAQALTGSFASSNAKFDVDSVTLVYERLINLGDHIQVNPVAGLQVAYLKQDITSNYEGVGSDTNPYSITSYNTSKFTGIGPRVGLDANYYFTPAFAVSIKLGTGLLMGTMQSITSFRSYGAGNKTPVNTSLSDISQNTVVPEVDTKIEASYRIAMKQSSSITFAAGYTWSDYVNGIDQVFPTSLVPGAFNGGAIAIETSAQTQSDLTLNGPYLTMVWKI